MKIKTKKLSFEKVLNITPPRRKKPKKPSAVLSKLVNIISCKDLKKVCFTYEFPDRGKIAGKPCLILMNHSSFIDMEIASKIFYPERYNIVATCDGLVGKYGIMRSLGCIPTKKFVTDAALIGDIQYALHKNKTSVLMYPEASYSFDGCATALPRRLGLFIKKLGVNVVTVKTHGAFLRDPLYNCLQKRNVKVYAEAKVLFTPETLGKIPPRDIDDILDREFSFDAFAEQKADKIPITENFRADGLERILYKCPACGCEGRTAGKGAVLRCNACGKEYFMDEYGEMHGNDGTTEFGHIPDWYRWERDCIKQELCEGRYGFDIAVKIGIISDYKALYETGEGRLVHNENGFTLTGCGGKLRYEQKPLASYSLYADYFWYEIGDVICIGDSSRLYYCFPKQPFPVAKARLAAEELYKIKSAGLRKND